MASNAMVASCIKKFSVLFGGREVTEELTVLYAGFLRDLPDDVLEVASNSCIRTCRFFPTIAEIMDAADELGKEERNVGAEFFAVAAGKGIPDDPAFQNALYSIGGPRVIGEATMQELGFLRREFMKEYAFFRKEGRNLADYKSIEANRRKQLSGSIGELVGMVVDKLARP